MSLSFIYHPLFVFSLSLSFIVVFGVALIFVLLFVVALSRHKKAGVGELELVGRVARVEKTLEPEGAVLIGGEMWRARARTGALIERGAAVRIVGARGHLLEVELAEMS
ncbi:MAG: NfeD family protein [Pyrinomonadaceae bacterium]|nr:NfeD family protein [Pyrinomonadaceae bacterium]